MRLRTSGLPALFVLFVAVGTTIPLLTACSAGSDAPQYQVRTSQDTVSANIGSPAAIALRNAFFTAPAARGATASVSVTLGALLPGTDRLVDVSSPLAQQGRLFIGTHELGEVPISGQVVAVKAELLGLSQPLSAARYYPVVFTFAQAGAVTLQVPVLSPGVLPSGASSVPTAIPDAPVGGVLPLDERSQVPASPKD